MAERTAPPHHSDESGPAKKKLRLSLEDAPRFESEQVTVLVGTEPKQKTFYMYENQLSTHSDYFKAIFRGDWIEAKERLVKLPELKPEPFEIFLAFTATGKVYCTKMGDLRIGDDGSTKVDEEWIRLQWCWIAGDVLQSNSFKDAVIDTMSIKLAKAESFPVQLHTSVYAKTAGKNALKRFAVDLAAWHFSEATLLKHIKPTIENAEYLLDLAIRQGEMTGKGGKGPSPHHKHEPDCTYHEHAAFNTQCYKTMF